MKFRTYIIVALSATAFVPFVAWSVLHLGDMERRIAEADLEQHSATVDAAALVEERLQGINAVVELADRTLAHSALKEGGDLNLLLQDIVESHPFIKNLHVDHRTADGIRVEAFFPSVSVDGELRRGQNHDNRWHAVLIRALEGAGTLYSPVLLSSERMPEPLMTFGRRMTGLPEHILSGALACSPVFEDIRRNLESRGLAFALLDERKQYVWPLDRSRITRWEASLESGTVVDAAAGPVYMTSQKLHAGLPQWTVVVTRPEKSRMMVRTNLEVRMAFLALGVLLLTSAAGWLACWPLSNALRKLRGDIDEDYGDDRNTIEQGPEELREVQAAYRELRKRLHARQVSLEEKNVHLASTVVRRESELDAQERLFREVFEDMKDGIVLLDPQWRPQLENTSAASMMPGSFKHEMLTFCRRQFEAGEQDVAVYEAELDGAMKAWECRTFPFRAGRAPFAEGFCVICRDVTERQEVERMKNDLIGIVAHELKTPVTACRLQIDLMRKASGDTEELKALDSDLDHLNHIVSDWLSAAKIEGGNFSVHPKATQIGPLIRRAVRLVRSRHEFDFKMRVAEEAECLNVDPGAFVELVVNLVTNACRYVRPGERPNISFEVEAVQPWAVIRVKDHGIGFDPSLSERIFDRFYQVVSGRKRRTGGTGLGLVICRAICEAHGGSIKASCAEGETCFTIHLPLPRSIES